MRKFLCIVAAVSALTMLGSCDSEKFIGERDLPSLSRTFLSTHFSGVTVTWVVKDADIFNKDYTVYLSNGFEIDFTKSGDWDEVDGHIHTLPQSVLNLLPAGIIEYVVANYPNNTIVMANKEHYGYEIGLNGGFDLDFNHGGGFMRFDD